MSYGPFSIEWNHNHGSFYLLYFDSLFHSPFWQVLVADLTSHQSCNIMSLFINMTVNFQCRINTDLCIIKNIRYLFQNKPTLALWPILLFEKKSNLEYSYMYLSIPQYSPPPTFGLLPITSPWAYLRTSMDWYIVEN